MARPLRVEYPGAIYHVTCRMLGDWRSARTFLFRDDKDRERLIDRLTDRVEQYNIRLYLWVLMANHFHLVCETPQANLSAFMQSVLTAYTVYYNLRHGRHGHVFDGRYKAKLVEGDEYLLKLSRYVHLNPVCVGSIKGKPIQERVRHLRSYRWSSYGSYIGKAKALDFVQHEPILAQTGGRRGDRPRRYRQFVETGLAEDDEEFRSVMASSPRSIGGETFRFWVEVLHQKQLKGHNRPEDVSFRHVTEPVSASSVLAVLADVFEVKVEAFRQRRRNSVLRVVAARFLMRYAALNQRQVAALLDAGSGSAISKQIKRHEEAFQKDRVLKRTYNRADEKLKALQTGKPVTTRKPRGK